MQLLRLSMFPLILLSNNQQISDIYIEEFKKSQGFDELQTQIILPAKTSLTIDQIRQLKKELIMTFSKPRLIIFQSFESATNEAQNALLKLLEDSNLKNQFIMLVTQIGNILPTIISRSRVIDIEEGKTVYDEQTTDKIQSFLSKPDITYLSEKVFTVTTKEDASLLLNICIDVMRQKLLNDSLSTDLIKKTFDLLYKLEHNNLSPQLTVDNWIIAAIKESSVRN